MIHRRGGEGGVKKEQKRERERDGYRVANGITKEVQLDTSPFPF